MAGAAGLAVLITAAFAAALLLRNPNALWRVVHGLCVANEIATRTPSPCLAVDLQHGYAVLKDRSWDTEILVIPTARVTGIEDPAVLSLGSPNYWQSAWGSRRFVEANAHRPIARDDIALAVNSVYGRSQNQLHIHVDCVRADVERDLRKNLWRLSPAKWSAFRVLPDQRPYKAMWVSGADLGDHDPFRLLAANDPAARADMGSETLAVVGVTRADGEPGFVLLSDRANLLRGDRGHAESLLDHKCSLLQPGRA